MVRTPGNGFGFQPYSPLAGALLPKRRDGLSFPAGRAADVKQFTLYFRGHWIGWRADDPFSMAEFRLAQISDPHLSSRHPSLTTKFERVSAHIDAMRFDLVINSGDLAFDAASSPDNLAFARGLHDALPVPCRYLPGNHDIGYNPTELGPTPQ